MNTILSASFNKSANKLEHCPIADRAEFAFIWRSNVGKSTLINLICKKRELAKTSAKPGKTQLINYFDIVSGEKDAVQSSWYLVDLPGYGYAKISKEKRAERWDMICDYLVNKSNLAHVFVLIDSRLEPQAIDLDFVSRISGERLSFSLVFTKADKSTQKEVSRHTKMFMQGVKDRWATQTNHYITSCLKPHSVSGILQEIHDINQTFVVPAHAVSSWS